ncbi:hypothetical protein IT408_01245 [Candidatus Uhrbacteria bacterium]|nr:hypothetical protein [Candidatus Uhrbacteria bacterium]
MAEERLSLVSQDFRGEPMTDFVRSSIIRNTDVDAVIETVNACQKYATSFQTGTANQGTLDQLRKEMATVTFRHWQRMHLKSTSGTRFYFRSYPAGYNAPKDPISLTCQAIIGVRIPEDTFYLSRSFYKKRMDEWKRGAYAQRHHHPSTVEQAKKIIPQEVVIKSEEKISKDGAVVGIKKPQSAPTFSKIEAITDTCEPGTFEKREETDEGITLFVKPGATQWQLKNSCWAKEHDVSPAVVILANKARVTIPYCTAKPHTLPSVKDFDPQRWNMGHKGFLKLDDDANQNFVHACSPENIGYALQAGQKLFLPKKKVIEAQQTKHVDAKKVPEGVFEKTTRIEPDAAQTDKVVTHEDAVAESVDSSSDIWSIRPTKEPSDVQSLHGSLIEVTPSTSSAPSPIMSGPPFR